MVSEYDIKILIENSFGVEVGKLDTDLMDLGLIDSLEAMKLLTIIEKVYNINFPFIEYTKKDFFTVKYIANSINNKIK